MRKHIIAERDGTKFNVAWLSFQPDGAVSFGLRDRAYISAGARTNIGIWNAYNRVGIRFVNPSTPDALDGITNPHFTYHPIGQFHLRADRSDEIFRGIADVPIVLEQDGRMPWIRATSAPIDGLTHGASRNDSIEIEEWIVPATDNVSVAIEVDFIRPSEVGLFDDFSRKSVIWHDVGIRVTIALTLPQVATLSWFHFW